MPITTASRILVVDASPEVLALVKDTLALAGYANVETATSLEEGLRKFEASKPDVVFTDLPLSDPLAIEFPRRALSERPATRLIVATDLPAHHEAVILAVSHGAAEVLAKPLAARAVGAVMEELSGRRAADWAYG